jgi:hypothetical protein
MLLTGFDMPYLNLGKLENLGSGVNPLDEMN